MPTKRTMPFVRRGRGLARAANGNGAGSEEWGRSKSRILGGRRNVAPEETVRILRGLKKEVNGNGQAEQYYETLQQTFNHAIRFLPPRVLKTILERNGCSNAEEFKLHTFSNTLLLSPQIFNEVREVAGVPDADAFHIQGFSVLKIGPNASQRITLVPLVHEWIHSFDSAAGIRRSESSEEALAWGIHFITLSELHKTAPKSIEIRLKSTISQEYFAGVQLGKEIAIAAREIETRKGSPAAQRFFYAVFNAGELDKKKVDTIRELLLRQDSKQ